MRTIVKTTRGFTLIEIVVSIAAIGVLFALLINTFAPEVVRGTDPLYGIRAAELGQSYLEEILGKKFDQNSPLGNALRCNETPQTPANPCTTAGSLGPDTISGVTETRANYNDVDDYNNLSESPHDASNGVRNGYTGFAVSISVAYKGTEIGLPNDTDAKRIDVTVSTPTGGTFKFSAYKANF